MPVLQKWTFLLADFKLKTEGETNKKKMSQKAWQLHPQKERKLANSW